MGRDGGADPGVGPAFRPVERLGPRLAEGPVLSAMGGPDEPGGSPRGALITMERP